MHFFYKGDRLKKKKKLNFALLHSLPDELFMLVFSLFVPLGLLDHFNEILELRTLSKYFSDIVLKSLCRTYMYDGSLWLSITAKECKTNEVLLRFCLLKHRSLKVFMMRSLFPTTA
jgi:hypothetical protein